MTPTNALLSPLFSHVHHGAEPDILEDESFKRMFSPRQASRNCTPNSVLSKDFIVLMDFVLGCNDKGSLLLLPLPPLLLSKRPGLSRFVEATVTRCTLEDLTFVSTLFETRESYSWYSTVGLEDSKHILLKFSSFLRNYEPYFTIDDLSKFIWTYSGAFNDGTCTGW